jgi:hypothetical protein
MNLDPAIIKLQIDNLRLQFPELESDEETWLLSLESETDLDGFLAKLVDRLDEESALAGGLAGMIAQWEVRLARYEARQKRLRMMALVMMQAAGVKKKELPTATLSVSKGREKVVINDDASVPDGYCRFKREPNLTMIKEMLAGKDAEPVNWAALVQGEPTLTVRRA